MFAFLAAAALLSAAEPQPPSGRWIVNFAATHCSAQRAYGEDHLVVRASPMGDSVQLGIVSPGRGGDPVQDEVTLRLSDGSSIRGSMLSWSPGGPVPRRVRQVSLPRADFERLTGSQHVRIDWADRSRHWTLSGMPALDTVMTECVNDLQRDFPTVEEAGGTGPTGNLAAFFTPDDYPVAAIRREEQGASGFALLVDETGRIVDCTITQTSGVAALDAQSCAVISRRARMTPATDASGKPRKSRLQSRIRWVMP